MLLLLLCFIAISRSALTFCSESVLRIGNKFNFRVMKSSSFVLCVGKVRTSLVWPLPASKRAESEREGSREEEHEHETQTPFSIIRERER
jgi:hypothetical protein